MSIMYACILSTYYVLICMYSTYTLYGVHLEIGIAASVSTMVFESFSRNFGPGIYA